MQRLLTFLALLFTPVALCADIELPLANAQCISWNMQGSHLAAATDSTLALVEGYTGSIRIAPVYHVDRVSALVWSPDGKTVVTGDNSGRTIVWQPSMLMPRHIIDSKNGTVTALAWNTNATRFAVGYANGVVELRDGATGKNYRTILEPISSVSTLAWHNDLLLIGGMPVSAIYHTGQFRRLRLRSSSSEVTAAQWNAEGTRVFMAFADGEALFHDLKTGKESQLFTNRQPIISAVWNSAESRISLASQSGEITTWNSDNGTILEEQVISSSVLSVALRHSNTTHRLAYSDGRRVILYDLTVPSDIRNAQQYAVVLSARPNPAVDDVTVELTTRQPGPVRLALVDALGRERLILFDGVQTGEREQYHFDTRALPSGMYRILIEGHIGGARSIPLVIAR